MSHPSSSEEQDNRSTAPKKKEERSNFLLLLLPSSQKETLALSLSLVFETCSLKDGFLGRSGTRFELRRPMADMKFS